MGYNTTLGPLNRWASVLDQIRAGTFQIASTDPKTLAYRLHEALNSAKENNVEPYASMDIKFKTTPGYLYIDPQSPLIQDTLEGTTESFPAAVSAFDVVQSAHGKMGGTLEFPSYDGENLKMVETWAKAKGWMVTMKENTLTLTLGTKPTTQ